jgi:hypothetical protein
MIDFPTRTIEQAERERRAYLRGIRRMIGIDDGTDPLATSRASEREGRRKHSRGGTPRRAIYSNNGRSWPSVKEASYDLGCWTNAISQAIRRGWHTKGLTLAYEPFEGVTYAANPQGREG